jgi:hypothetical protein
MVTETIKYPEIRLCHTLTISSKDLTTKKVNDTVKEHDSTNGYGTGYEAKAVVIFKDEVSTVLRVVEKYISDHEVQSEEIKLVQIA